jgi:hypothetical protein
LLQFTSCSKNTAVILHGRAVLASAGTTPVRCPCHSLVCQALCAQLKPVPGHLLHCQALPPPLLLPWHNLHYTLLSICTVAQHTRARPLVHSTIPWPLCLSHSLVCQALRAYLIPLARHVLRRVHVEACDPAENNIT